MAGFCVTCGAPLTGAFCNKCGARAVSPGTTGPVQPVAQPPFAPSTAQPGAWTPVSTPSLTPPAAQPQGDPSTARPAAWTPVPTASPSQPATTAAKGSGLGKVLAIVAGVLVLLFVIGIAGAVYGVYWVKHKVTSYASAVTGGSSGPIKVVEHGDNCRLLSTAEVQKVLGVAVEKNAEIRENSTPGCAYYTNQEAFNQLQRMAAEQAKRQTEEVNKRPGPKPDNLPALMKNANQLEGVVKALAMTQPVEDGRVFSFTVQNNFGPDSWSGMRLTESAVPGFEEVPGIGDHAMIGAFGHALYILKGDKLISLNTTWVPDARTRGAQLGRKIMANL
jgi:hypothetical protein